jgi:thioredoxin-like negative regulator of GroEL
MPPILLSLMLAASIASPRRSVGPEASLQRGQYLRAIQLFTGAIQRNPESERLKIGLGRAQIALGKCQNGLDTLAGLHSSTHWSTLSAAAVGSCALRGGDYSLAIAHYHEAVALDPNSARAWFGLFRAQLMARDGHAAAQSLEQLRQMEKAAGFVPTAQLWLDNTTSSMDIDSQLQQILNESHGAPGGPSPTATRRLSLANAERWLDLGDPLSALPLLEEAHRRGPGNVRAAALLAEAHRRLGNTTAAFDAISKAPLSHAEHPLMLSIRIRLAHDHGDDVRHHPDWAALKRSQNTEAFATLWYVFHRQDPAKAEAAKQSFLSQNLRPDQVLSTLHPWIQP